MSGDKHNATDQLDRQLLWRMAIGFGVGSALFAVGQIVAWTVPNPTPSNWVFTFGAIFFTIGATIQWQAAIVHHPDFNCLRNRAIWDATNPDWLSAASQWIGTVMFNVMTLVALWTFANSRFSGDGIIWGSNMIGSVLFLISSLIAMHGVVRARRHRLVIDRSNTILALNLIGSVLFGVSALAGKFIGPGVVDSEYWMGIGTFWGALAFLAAALLLIPPRSRSDR